MDIKIRIEGISPLICNRFTAGAQRVATSGSRMSAAGGERGSPREQAQEKLYKDDSAKLVIPGPNIMSCIIAAGKFFKAGKSKVTTMKTSLIPACVFMSEPAVPLLSAEGWCVDERAVRIPSTGGRILCYRPRFNDWALEFTVELDEELMTGKLLREIVDSAGKRIGLGDFRPDCKGPFGRFVVTSWEQSNGISKNPPKRTRDS